MTIDRYELPELQTFQDKIADDDFDIERADQIKNIKEKAIATERKASKSWRALRIASKTKLSQFDKIDNPERIAPIFDDITESGGVDDSEDVVNTEDMPQDMTPIILSGPNGGGKTTVANMLMEKHRGVFAKVIRHTNRQREGGETDGQDFNFVTPQNFNVMLDGDQFIEFENLDGYDVGTSRRSVEAISDSGKIALMEMSREVSQKLKHRYWTHSNDGLEAVKMTKDTGFLARLILIKPPSMETLAERLKGAGSTADVVQESVKAAEAEMSDADGEQLFDIVILNEDLETTYNAIEGYVFSCKSTDELVNGRQDSGEGDQTMTEAPNTNADHDEVDLIGP
jgi:THO complex subunit 1